MKSLRCTSVVAAIMAFLLTSTFSLSEAAVRSSSVRVAPTVKVQTPVKTSGGAVISNRSTVRSAGGQATKAYIPTSKVGKVQTKIGSTSAADWNKARVTFLTNKTPVFKSKLGKTRTSELNQKYFKKYGNKHNSTVFNDPFNHAYIWYYSPLWWHHHIDEVDLEQYDEETVTNLRGQIAQYEDIPRDTDYMDEGMDETVMYCDGYLARVKAGTFGMDNNPVIESSGFGGCFIATAAHAGQKKSKKSKKKKKKKKKLSFGDDDDDDFEGGGCFIATAQAAQKKKKVVKKPVVKKKASVASTTAKPVAKVYDKKGNQIDPKTGKIIKKKKTKGFEIEDDGDINVFGVEVYDPDDDEDDDDERYERRQQPQESVGAGILLALFFILVFFGVVVWLVTRKSTRQ